MKKLLILTYHAVDSRPSVISISPELFRYQMETLAKHRLRGVSMIEALDHYEQHRKFPEDSVALSFDDGYLHLMDNVLPVLRDLDFTATVFVVSGMVGMDAGQAHYANADFDRDLLGWGHLETLLKDGFEIGSHTLSHPWLSKLSESEAEYELEQSGRNLQKRLQVPIRSLAYPYGDVNRAVKETASRFYEYACGTRLGRNPRDPDLLDLKRVDAYYLQNPKVFSRLITGGLEAYLRLRQYARNLKQLVG